MLYKNGYSKSAILIHAVFLKCFFECAISSGAILSGHLTVQSATVTTKKATKTTKTTNLQQQQQQNLLLQQQLQLKLLLQSLPQKHLLLSLKRQI